METRDPQGALDVGPSIPVDRDRAADILALHGVDGLIALQPYNVYYLTNTVPVLTAFNAEFPAFGVFGGTLRQTFYVGSAGSLWDMARDGREIPDRIAFTGVANADDYIGAGANPLDVRPKPFTGGFAVSPTAPLSPTERLWRDLQDTYNSSAEPSREWALVRAIREAGLEGRRIAVDDMRIPYLLGRIGYEGVTWVPGEDIFRHIRLIKSDYEIDLLRQAQRATQHAVTAAARQLEPGMTYDQFRLAFDIACATQGASSAFLLFGVAQGQLPDGVVTRGRPYMVDSSARVRQYMGDFARTICVGEPSVEAMRRHRAQQIGRAEALDKIRPGVAWSTVEQTARTAMIKAGMPEHVIAACYMHSVGLQHEDQPWRLDSPFPMRQSFVCEPGMVMTLDLPYLELGVGAGHNEDMIRVTATGYELLNDPIDPMIIV
ncbi:MAG: M24 family metallopeptidase [Azospirillaceae bacterium]|nr:M24 family metallopeptidase [Azospirillaceae bacterium]